MTRQVILGMTVWVLMAGGVFGQELDVPLVLRETVGLSRSGEPVTGGVPLPEGLLKDVKTLRVLDPFGKEAPAQFAVMNRWWRDGSIRWVLVDFQADVRGGAESIYRLTTGGKGSAADSPLKVTADEKKVTVVTGPMKFTVKRAGFNLIDELWLDESGQGRFDAEHQVVKSSPENGIQLYSAHGYVPSPLRYSPSYYEKNTLEVEEVGPMRVALKITGKHACSKDPARTLLDFTCRIHAYAGTGLVKVVYSVECKQGESIGSWIPVHRLTVGLRGDLGENQRYRFGSEGPILTGELRPYKPPHTDWRAADRAFLFADSSDHYWGGGCLRGHEGPGKSAKPCDLGWVDVTGSKAGITGGVKWFWQTWPKCVDATVGNVELHLVPNLEGRVALYPRHTLGQAVNFFPGVSKTHELIFNVHGPKKVQPDGAWAMLSYPVRPLPAAEWICRQSQGLGRLASADRRLYDDATWSAVRQFDNKFGLTVRTFQGKRDRVRNTDCYGMFNFGDTVNFVSVHRRWLYGDRIGGTQVTWCNMYYDWPHGLFLQGLRLDRRDWIEQAIEHTWPLQDVHIVCWHPDPGMIGANRYCDGTDHIRQTSGVYVSNTYNHYKNQSLYVRYWLTGDRRALDMALLSSDFALRRGTASLSQPRSVGHGMQGLNYAYLQTGDAKYLRQARNIMNRCKAGMIKGYGGRLWQGGIALEGFVTYYQLTGDAEARDAVLKNVAGLAKTGRYAGSAISSIAWSCGQTGDPKQRALLLKAMKGMGVYTHAGGGGNNLRNAGYLFWYLTRDLPKKDDVKPLKF